MFQFCSLYSGSSGNCSFVQTNNTKILIDAGESAKKIVEALTSINVDPSTIDAILVTHEHSDHVKGLGIFSKKFQIPVYANLETWNAMPKQKEKIEEDKIRTFSFDKFNIKDIEIKPFSIPHDAANPCGFNLYHENKKMSIATDIGHMNKEIINHLTNSSFMLLEANYEPEILKCSSYPYLLKERIKGPNGHLSNSDAGKTISYLVNHGLNNVMLGHLSKENNFPELAYKTVVEELIENHLEENSLHLSVAERYN
ncbi:MAG: MBL fold metallo-hydrolase, partial [Clostridia bacterium]|nr:MBL fold metallo-hydrolase [Clostridia bacterium]